MAKLLLKQMERQLNNSSDEYLEEASRRKKKSLKLPLFEEMPYLHITEVYVVHNNYLRLMYELKKKEYQVRFGTVIEKQLYHSTSESNVMSIIKENLDWRRVSRNKYGKGVSFSDDPDYANFYSNSRNGQSRAFIVANVLISNTCGGNSSMKVPPVGKDTLKGNNKVYVKFHDNEFLPLYVVYYEAPKQTRSKYYRRRF